MSEEKVNEEIGTEEAVETEKVTREWVAIREECVSGGSLTPDCNLVAAAQGLAQIEVVYKKLSCGCILVPEDTEDEILL